MTKTQAPSLTKAPRSVRRQAAKLTDAINEHLALDGVPVTKRTPELMAMFIALLIEQKLQPIFDAEEAEDNESFADLRTDAIHGLALGCGRILGLLAVRAKDPIKMVKLFTKLTETYASTESLVLQQQLTAMLEEEDR